jgi:hypothetical protein
MHDPPVEIDNTAQGSVSDFVMPLEAVVAPPLDDGFPHPLAARRPSRTLQIAALLAAAVVGFFCGAGFVALLWLSTLNRSESGSYRSVSQRVAPASGAGRMGDNHPDRLITANPIKQASIPPSISKTKPLLASDLAFGERQVARMTKDRPEMLRYVKKGDPIWSHCARAFAGESIGERVYWDSTPPHTDETPAEHMGPWQGSHGYIRVCGEYKSGYEKGTALTCEELWACASYELENIKGTPGFNKLYNLALSGKLNREQWIRENTRLEYEACKRTQELYRSVWLPAATRQAVPATGRYWFVGLPERYEDWIAMYDDPSGYPWAFFGKYWDDEVMPYLRRTMRQ